MAENKIIPTIIFDNFFENPNWVRDFALSLEYNKDVNNRWPGERTKPIHEINYDFFAHVMHKFFVIFYPDKDPSIFNYEYNVTMYFQKINPIDYGKSGWIHYDNELITGIIYLNDDYNPNSGTSIYELKKGWQCLHGDKKIEYYSGKLDEQNAEKYRLENNYQFEEVVNLKNKFNRMIAFDSHLAHGANEFYSNTQDRLTLVFFVTSLRTDYTPIDRSIRIMGK
jgi:hypothetical protein